MTIENWQRRSLAFQLTSVNADLHRAVHQRALGEAESAHQCLETALELIDRTIVAQTGLHRRRELGRLRELVADKLLPTPCYSVTLQQLIAFLEPYGLIVARERGLA